MDDFLGSSNKQARRDSETTMIGFDGDWPFLEHLMKM